MKSNQSPHEIKSEQLALPNKKSWLARLLGGILLSITLGIGASQISGYGTAAMYAASWIVLLHVFIGEYVLVRHLHAVSRNQNALDLLAFTLLLGGMLSFHKTALWCAFLAGAFSLVVIKYLIIERAVQGEILHQYVREKIRWESPAVVLFMFLAVIISYLPQSGAIVRILESTILAASAFFAFWMIGVRHAYRRVAKTRKNQHNTAQESA